MPTLLDANGSSVVSFKYLPESDSLCVVLANGDIEQVFEPGSGEGVEKRVSCVLWELGAGTRANGCASCRGRTLAP